MKVKRCGNVRDTIGASYKNAAAGVSDSEKEKQRYQLEEDNNSIYEYDLSCLYKKKDSVIYK